MSHTPNDFAFDFAQGIKDKHERFDKFDEDGIYHYAYSMFELYSRKDRNYITSDKFRISDRIFSIRIPESGSGFCFIYIKCDTGDYPIQLIDIEEVQNLI